MLQVKSIHWNSSLIQAWNTITYYDKRFETEKGEHSDTPQRQSTGRLLETGGHVHPQKHARYLR